MSGLDYYTDDELEEYWERLHPSNVYGTLCEKMYHYTTLNTLWKIIDNDTMFATNVRFSNDSEEYRIGEEIVNRAIDSLTSQGKKLLFTSNYSNFYMLCFCKTDNLLSQWREYARGGVSLQFDFTYEHFFSIMDEKNESAIQRMVVKPIKVFYVDKNNTRALAKIRSNVKKLYKLYKGKPDDIRPNYLFGEFIPYIKHVGFREEKELRLLFRPEPINVKSFVGYLDKGGLLKPYIKISCKGLSSSVEAPSVMHGVGANNKVIEYCNQNGIAIRCNNRMNSDEFVLNDCKDQETEFKKIKKMIDAVNYLENTNIKLWCEGHLPIRQITVGPSENRDDIKESIEHKLRSIYWLNYVSVQTSDIPYRDKRE